MPVDQVPVDPLAAPGFAKRLFGWQLALAALGGAGWMLMRGSSFALSFLFGAVAAAASFWLLYRAIATAGTGRTPTWAAVLGVFRLLLIGGAISVTLRTYELQSGAAASGILVVVASILLEVVREHFHGT